MFWFVARNLFTEIFGEKKISFSQLVSNRVWSVNLRERTRTVDAFIALMKDLYKPQSKKIHRRHVNH